jgi:ankyrin repeat protein
MLKMKMIFFLMLSTLLLFTSACENWSPENPTLTTLFVAADHGDVAAIRNLLSKGKNVNEIDPYGKTPLAYAVIGHHMDAAKTLITVGADATVKTRKGYDLVMLSLYNEMDSSLDMLNYLVSLGLSVNQVTIDGDSALNIAISSQHEKAVVRLVSLGARPNEKSIEILGNQTHPNQAILRIINDMAKSQGIAPAQQN